MSAREKVFIHHNTIIELSQMISEKAWGDESIKDRFVIAALADGINAAAQASMELAECYLEDKDSGGKSDAG